jgi:hypothetical protein
VVSDTVVIVDLRPLSLLDMGQAARTLRLVGGHQGSNGELRQRDGRDERDIGQSGRIRQTAERQQRAGVQGALGVAHSD